MTKVYVLLSGMLLAVSGGYAQTRYVSASGTDAGDCSLPGSPCATLNYAVSQAVAGDSVVLAPGNYSFAATQVIDKTLTVTAADVADKPVITSGASDVIAVNAADVTVNGLHLNMGLTATTGMRGLVLDTQFDGITLSNNEIVSTKTFSTGMVFGAYGIVAYGGNGTEVTVTGNTVKPAGLVNDAFGRGIGLGLNGVGAAPGGEVSGNTVQAFYSVQAVAPSTDLSIADNRLSGTAMVSFPANGTEVIVEDNTFSGENDLVAANLYALLDIRGVDGANVKVLSNDFEKYVNIGLLSMASRHVAVDGNTFSPSATAANFISLHANSKLMTSGVQNDTYANEIDITGNTFNAGVTNNGTAVWFADHYGATTPAFADSIKIGGTTEGEKNTFASGIKNFIGLDSSAGNSNTVALWSSYAVTAMKPFTWNVYAFTAWNNYPTNDTAVLETLVFDVADNSNLGDVVFLPADASIANNSLLQVTAYPNPATEVLYISSKELTGNSSVEIIDANGRVVSVDTQTSAGNVLTVSVAHLDAGVYFVRVQNKGAFFGGRFVKQ